MLKEIRYAYDFQFPHEMRRRSKWYCTAVERDLPARKTAENGATVWLTEEHTDVTVHINTTPLKVETPEEEARKRVLASPVGTLYLSRRRGVYQRQGSGSPASLLLLSANKYIERLELPPDFFQSLQMLVPEAK